MLKKAILPIAVLASSLCAINASADVGGKVSLGYHMGEWEVPGDELVTEGDLGIVTVSGSLLFNGGWYTSLSYGTSEESGDLEWDFLDSQGVVVSDSELEYEQVTVTVGHTSEDGLTAFLGYQDKTAENKSVLEVPGLSDQLGPIGTLGVEVDVSGVFFGVGKYWALPKGGISLTGALAVMEGDLNTSTSGRFIEDEEVSDEADFALGYSLGIGYSLPIGEHFSVVADVKWQDYTLDYGDVIGEVSEEILMYGITLNYTFGGS